MYKLITVVQVTIVLGLGFAIVIVPWLLHVDQSNCSIGDR